MLRFLMERYPLIAEQLACQSVYPFQRVYLELNLIIEGCVRLALNEDNELDEEKFCVYLFQHIDCLLTILRPEKELILALDGSLPNALIPNFRIFRSLRYQNRADKRRVQAGVFLRDSRIGVARPNGDRLKKKHDPTKQETNTTSTGFDFYNLVPGTPFSDQVERYLFYYVCVKLHTDGPFKNLQVSFLNSSQPGDGKHKILEFLRRSRKKKDSCQQNERLCIYCPGLDCAMTCLGSPNENVSLLLVQLSHEVSNCTEQINPRIFGTPLTCQLIHLSLLRQCLILDLVFASRNNISCSLPINPQGKKSVEEQDNSTSVHDRAVSNQEDKDFDTDFHSRLQAFFNSEKVQYCIMDFMLLCILCNHSTAPQLPFFDVETKDLSSVLDIYRSFIQKQSLEDAQWLTLPDGDINWPIFLSFLQLFSSPTPSQTKDSEESRLINKPSTETEDNKMNTPMCESRLILSDARTSLKDSSFFRCNGVDSTALPCFPPPSFCLRSQQKTDPDKLYYFLYFGWDVSQTENDTKLQYLSLCFCKALQWTLWYFCRGVIDWLWSYPFRYVPLLHTLLSFSPKIFHDIKFSQNTKPLPCTSQLCYFLPFSRLSLFPPSMRDFVSKHSQTLLFPETFSYNSLKNMDFVSLHIKNHQMMLLLNSVKRIDETNEPPSVTNAHPIHSSMLIKRDHRLTWSSFLKSVLHDCRLFTAHDRTLSTFFDADLVYVDKTSSISLCSPFPRTFISLAKCCVKVNPMNFSLDELSQNTESILDHSTNSYTPPSLLKMRINNVAIQQSRSTWKSKYQPKKECLHLTISPSSQLCSSVNDQSISRDTQLYDVLRSLAQGDVCMFDYPYHKPGKITGFLLGNAYFRKRDLHFKGMESAGIFEIIDDRPCLGKTHVKKPDFDTAFLYRTDTPQLTLYQEELYSQLCRLESLGLHLTSSQVTMDTQCLAKALSMAVGKDCSKCFTHEDFKTGQCLNHILVELLPVSETITAPSHTMYRFHPQPLYRPLPLLLHNLEKQDTVSCEQMDCIKPGDPVMCVNRFNPLFGCTGYIETVGKTWGTTESWLEVYQNSYDDRWTLQQEIYNLTAEDLKKTKWYYLEEVAQMTKLPQRTLMALLQSVWVEVEDGLVVDIGFHLYSIKDNVHLCVPSYTSFIPDYEAKPASSDNMKLFFTDAAVELLYSFKSAWPTVIDCLMTLKNHKKKELTTVSYPIKLEKLFPKKTAKENFKRLQEWYSKKNLANAWQAGPSTQSLSLEGVNKIQNTQDAWTQKYKTCYRVKILGSSEVYPICQTAALPDILLAASPHRYIKTNDFSYLGRLLIGQRVVYVKWDGEIPFGAFGCVTATTLDPDGLEQWVEIITEHPYLGCSDLNGRCSPFRGIHVQAASLMPIVPEVLPWGLSISSLSEYQTWIQDSVRRLQYPYPTQAISCHWNYSPHLNCLKRLNHSYSAVDEELHLYKVFINSSVANDTLCPQEDTVSNVTGANRTKESKDPGYSSPEEKDSLSESSKTGVVERLLEYKSQLQTLQKKNLSFGAENKVNASTPAAGVATSTTTISSVTSVADAIAAVFEEHRSSANLKTTKKNTFPPEIQSPKPYHVPTKQSHGEISFTSTALSKKYDDTKRSMNLLLNALKRGASTEQCNSGSNVQYGSKVHPVHSNGIKEYVCNYGACMKLNRPMARHTSFRQQLRSEDRETKMKTPDAIGHTLLNILHHGSPEAHSHQGMSFSKSENAVSKYSEKVLLDQPIRINGTKEELKYIICGNPTHQPLRLSGNLNDGMKLFHSTHVEYLEKKKTKKKNPSSKTLSFQSDTSIPNTHYKTPVYPVAPACIPTFLPRHFF